MSSRSFSNGTSFRGRLSVSGGETYLGLRREIRDGAGIDVGDVVEVVLEAKRADTRERRAERALEMLRSGIKHP
ncbi:MAG: hypothetical protein QOJ89_1858 [bacterium]|jgi:hypothetical protein